MAKLEGVEVTFTTKVEVAVGETEIFSHFVRGIVEREGRGFRLIMDDDVTCKEFDVTGIEVGIFSTFVPVADFSVYLDNTLGLEFGEEFGKGLVLRIKNDLRLALPVAKIKEEYAPMIAEGINPSDEGGG
jgi:hypothetical protein